MTDLDTGSIERAGSRGLRLSVLRCMTVLLMGALFLGAPQALAQVLDYGKLLGSGQAEETPQQSTPLQPLPAPTPTREGIGQSTPQTGGPTIADYGLVAETVPDPMLDATRQAVTLFRARVMSTINRLPQAKADVALALAAASPTGKGSYFIGVAVFAGLLIVIGRAITALYAIYIARPVIIRMQKRS